MSPIAIGLWLAAVGSALLVVLRVVRRLDDRDRAELEADARLDPRLPGASPGSPLEVFSAAAVEPRVEALPCPRCGGRCHVIEHAVHHTGEARLRRVTTRCGGCGDQRDVFLRLREAVLH